MSTYTQSHFLVLATVVTNGFRCKLCPQACIHCLVGAITEGKVGALATHAHKLPLARLERHLCKPSLNVVTACVQHSNSAYHAAWSRNWHGAREGRHRRGARGGAGVAAAVVAADIGELAGYRCGLHLAMRAITEWSGHARTHTHTHTHVWREYKAQQASTEHRACLSLHVPFLAVATHAGVNGCGRCCLVGHRRRAKASAKRLIDLHMGAITKGKVATVCRHCFVEGVERLGTARHHTRTLDPAADLLPHMQKYLVSPAAISTWQGACHTVNSYTPQETPIATFTNSPSWSQLHEEGQAQVEFALLSSTGSP